MLGTEWLQSWAADVEAWILELSHTPVGSWAQHQGRTKELAWVRTRLGDDRQCPVKGVKVVQDLSTAARACETIKLVVETVLIYMPLKMATLALKLNSTTYLPGPMRFV